MMYLSSFWKILLFSSRRYLFVLQDRAPGEPFAAKSSKEAEMEKLLKSMEVFYPFFPCFIYHIYIYIVE